jgi:hypothetical protein
MAGNDCPVAQRQLERSSAGEVRRASRFSRPRVVGKRLTNFSAHASGPYRVEVTVSEGRYGGLSIDRAVGPHNRKVRAETWSEQLVPVSAQNNLWNRRHHDQR